MAKQKPTDATSPDQVFDEIAGLVDGFCKEHLNGAYSRKGAISNGWG